MKIKNNRYVFLCAAVWCTLQLVAMEDKGPEKKRRRITTLPTATPAIKRSDLSETNLRKLRKGIINKSGGQHREIRDVSVIRGLIENKIIDVNFMTNDKHSSTLLTDAIGKHNEIMIDMLIAHNVSLDKWSWRGITPLYETVNAHNLQAMRKLIAAGADVNVQMSAPFETNGSTALHFAASRLEPEFVSTLIDAHAKVNIDSRGQTPFHSAVEGALHSAVLLTKDKDTFNKLYDVINLLFVADERGHRPGLFIKDNEGNTPIDIASVSNLDRRNYHPDIRKEFMPIWMAARKVLEKCMAIFVLRVWKPELPAPLPEEMQQEILTYF